MGLEHGEFEPTFGGLLDEVTDRGQALLPTFDLLERKPALVLCG